MAPLVPPQQTVLCHSGLARSIAVPLSFLLELLPCCTKNYAKTLIPVFLLHTFHDPSTVLERFSRLWSPGPFSVEYDSALARARSCDFAQTVLRDAVKGQEYLQQYLNVSTAGGSYFHTHSLG